jgi:putative GTP pyrophosphokinase
MSLASEIIARSEENMKSCHPDLDNIELVYNFLKIEKEIGLIDMLKKLLLNREIISNSRNFILIFSGKNNKKNLDVRGYKNSGQAMEALFVLEKTLPDADIVYVRGENIENIRFSFRNYFSDANDFINLIEKGCIVLSRG